MLFLFHNILVEAGSRWLCSEKKGGAQAVDIDDWTLPSSDEDNAPAAQQQEQVVQAGDVKTSANPAASWAAFNKRQKRSAKIFIKSNPVHRIVITLVCFSISISFLHVLERIGSQAWKLSQVAASARGRSTRAVCLKPIREGCAKVLRRTLTAFCATLVCGLRCRSGAGRWAWLA